MKRFALAGNPNSGKTTLFNSLTGATAHVGNWPGVTVDKREGTYRKLHIVNSMNQFTSLTYQVFIPYPHILQKKLSQETTS